MGWTELSSRSPTASAEAGFNLRDLGQLLWRELGLERIDRLHQVLGVATPFNRIVGKAPRMLEGLTCLPVGSST